MVNLVAPKTFRFLEFVLQAKSFTQYQAVKELGLSDFLVNQVTNYLVRQGFVRREEKKYVLGDTAGLLLAVKAFRDMTQIQLLEANTGLNKEEAMKLMPRDAVFCLDSALSQYTGWWRSNTVCAYVTEKQAKAIRESLFYRPGNQTTIKLFKESPKVTEKPRVGGRLFTSKIRTVIDLVCATQAHAAQPLFEELWGIKLGPT